MAVACSSSDPACSGSSVAGRSSSCNVSSMLLCWSYFLHLALQVGTCLGYIIDACVSPVTTLVQATEAWVYQSIALW